MIHHTSKLKGHSKSQQRHQLKLVQQYLQGEDAAVCVLYGLRRTGKTTLIEQSIDWLQSIQAIPPEDILYITASNNGSDSMLELFTTIANSTSKYIFIDEISFFTDFIEDAARLYDDFTRVRNKKIVIAGTNLTSIFVANLTTLFGRIHKILVHHLTFYEYMHFVVHKDTPVWDDFIQYLKTGGLFVSEDCNAYLQTSIIAHLNDTLLGGAVRQVYSWIDSSRFEYVGWEGLINNICLYSAGNVNNTVLRKMNSLRKDVGHLQLSSEVLYTEVIDELQKYFGLSSVSQGSLKQNEVAGLLRFLIDCGFLLQLDNIAPTPATGDRSKVYLTFPFMRYAFTGRVAHAFAVSDANAKSELLGELLEGCAISEYHLAYPDAPIHFWREKIGDHMEECDLVVTDATEIIPTSNRREAIEFKLGHDGGYSGLYALQQSHPEYELPKESCKKLEHEEVMKWIFNLGYLSYTGAAQPTSAFDNL